MSMPRPFTCIPYAGGKSRVVSQLVPCICEYDEYREPFAGGLCVGIWHMQRFPDKRYWINDLHFPIFNFWDSLKTDSLSLVRFMLRLNDKFKGRPDELYYHCKSEFKADGRGIEHAAYTWFRHVMSFGGIGIAWNIGSVNKHKPREARIINLLEMGELLNRCKVKITNLDYSELLKSEGSNVFIFADPPYDIKSCFYGCDGKLHRGFNHKEFASNMRNCEMNWLVTYNDNLSIRRAFAEYYMKEFDVQYTVGSKRVVQELMITNYDFPIRDKWGQHKENNTETKIIL